MFTSISVLFDSPYVTDSEKPLQLILHALCVPTLTIDIIWWKQIELNITELSKKKNYIKMILSYSDLC